MTKEELLSHHIMIPDHFRTEELRLYCQNGYKLLYKSRHSNVLRFVIIHEGKDGNINKTKVRDHVRCITDDSYKNILIDGNHYFYEVSPGKFEYIYTSTIFYENIDEYPRKRTNTP